MANRRVSVLACLAGTGRNRFEPPDPLKAEWNRTVHIAYVMATFPEPSETFATRRMLGALEARLPGDRVYPPTSRRQHRHNKHRRPACGDPLIVAGAGTWLALLLLTVSCPLWEFRLARCLVVMALHSPRWSLLLLCNIHAVAFFAMVARQTKVDCIYAYFMDLPGVIGWAASAVATFPSPPPKQHVRDHHDLQQQIHAALTFQVNLAAQRPALGPLCMFHDRALSVRCLAWAPWHPAMAIIGLRAIGLVAILNGHCGTWATRTVHPCPRATACEAAAGNRPGLFAGMHCR